MIFHRSNFDDIRRYYNNTIIKLPSISGDRLWHIGSISPDEVRLSDVDGMEVYIDLNEEYEVEYPLPGRAVYQTNNGRAAMLYRKPSKQYYRGLHKENTGLLYMAENGEWGNLGWGMADLQGFVDKPCYTDPNLIDVNEGTSWALNKHMAVCRLGSVSVLQNKVALLNWKSKNVEVLNKMFKPELEAVFQGWSVK